MSDDEYELTAEDHALFEAELERLRQQELPRAREVEIKAAAQRAVEQDVEAEHVVYREELEDEIASAGGEQSQVRREAPSKILMLAVMLILLFFILAATGGLRSLFDGNRRGEQARLAPKGALAGVLDGPTTTPVTLAPALAGDPAAGGVDAFGSVPAPAIEGVDGLFATYYAEHDGVRLFGLPLSTALEVNGRRIQWFERARLEHWPEYADTPYALQPGLVGREYTDGRDFPKQSFFPNRPGLVFFPETSHGVGGQFLDFWTANGGLDIFGYPISDEFPEMLDDGRIRRVQYFERARMEAHPRPDGSGDEIMLGLLGRGLYLQEPRPEPVAVPAPTPVPIP